MNTRFALSQSLRSTAAGAALLVLSAGISVTLSPTIALAQDHEKGGSKGGHESGGDGDSCGGCEDGGHGSSGHEGGGCEDSGGSCEDGGSGGSGHHGGQGRAPGEASGTHGDRSIEDIFRETPRADAAAPVAEGHDSSDESRSHSNSGKSGAGQSSPPSNQQGDR